MYVTIVIILNSNIGPGISCNVEPSFYVDCFPGRNVTQENCEEAECCWRSDLGICFHGNPAKHSYASFNESYSRGKISLIWSYVESLMKVIIVNCVH